MNIAALASVMKQSQVMQQVSISVAKITMDTMKSQSTELVKAMEQSVSPHLGQSVNIRV